MLLTSTIIIADYTMTNYSIYRIDIRLLYTWMLITGYSLGWSCAAHLRMFVNIATGASVSLAVSRGRCGCWLCIYFMFGSGHSVHCKTTLTPSIRAIRRSSTALKRLLRALVRPSRAIVSPERPQWGLGAITSILNFPQKGFHIPRTSRLLIISWII